MEQANVKIVQKGINYVYKITDRGVEKNEQRQKKVEKTIDRKILTNREM